MSDLFATEDIPDQDNDAKDRPLADRLRPRSLDDVIGQDHLLKGDAPLARMVRSGHIASIILWGPPGVGKTTIARLLADVGDYQFQQISAIFSGVAELRKIFDEASQWQRAGRKMLLFVDEIHRFNRSQQDSFLPHMESGLITLIGATTENPSFELNAALLSRAQVLTLHRLEAESMEALVKRAENVVGVLPLEANARSAMIDMADGDGRFLLSLVEEISSMKVEGKETAKLSTEDLTQLLQRRAPVYDKAQEGHYNLISALHKSVRGSDVNAALYWLARMLVSGEDPLYLARRLVRMASEDIGLADPQALSVCLAAKDAYEFLGSPEGELALAQATTYLATAPKSNGVYTAYKAAMGAARSSGSLMPPPFAMNAPTKLMKQQGYSDGYIYDHDLPDGYAGLDYFPPDMPREKFYMPVARGFEREIRKRLDYWDARRKGR